jgi:hypothetical protein
MQLCCQPQARAVDFKAAPELQVVSGKKTKQHDNSTYGRAPECWFFSRRQVLLFGTNLFSNCVIFKVQFGHCRVPSSYSANPKYQHPSVPYSNAYSRRIDKHTIKRFHFPRISAKDETPTSTTAAEHIRALQSVGFAPECWLCLGVYMLLFGTNLGHCLVPHRYTLSIPSSGTIIGLGCDESAPIPQLA